jgi:hypothetical protein
MKLKRKPCRCESASATERGKREKKPQNENENEKNVLIESGGEGGEEGKLGEIQTRTSGCCCTPLSAYWRKKSFLKVELRCAPGCGLMASLRCDLWLLCDLCEEEWWLLCDPLLCE